MARTGRPNRPVRSRPDVDALFGRLREECRIPPTAPGFLAGFRARRDAWQERTNEAASWRWFALRLAPLSAVAAAAALVLVVPGSRTPPAPPEAGTAAAGPEIPDPFAAGAGRVGVETLAMNGDDAGHELVAVLYEPIGAD